MAGASRLEILLFNLCRDADSDREEAFGINVFKLREVMHLPAAPRAPNMPPAEQGMIDLRGNTILVIDLSHLCGAHVKGEAKILIVTGYNRSTHGFMVSSVEQILRMERYDIKAPHPCWLSARAAW